MSDKYHMFFLRDVKKSHSKDVIVITKESEVIGNLDSRHQNANR
jgi:hypothetical protein